MKEARALHPRRRPAPSWSCIRENLLRGGVGFGLTLLEQIRRPQKVRRDIGIVSRNGEKAKTNLPQSIGQNKR